MIYLRRSFEQDNMKNFKLRNLKTYTTSGGSELCVDLNSVAAVETVGKYTQLYLPGCKVMLRDVDRNQIIKDMEHA